MGFNTATATAPKNNRRAAASAAPAQDGDYEQAIGFINLYLPTKGGGRRKLGAVALKASNVNEKTLCDWLAADPEANAAKILAAMQIEFRTSEPDPQSAFALPE